jgi:integrase
MTNPTAPANEFLLSAKERIRLLHLKLEMLWTILEEGPSEKTLTQYRNADDRMRERGMSPEEIGAKSRRSYNLYRAAYVYCTIERIANIYDELYVNIETMPMERARELMTRIERELMVLDEYPPRSEYLQSRWRSPDGGVVRKGKRTGLFSLPEDWRQKMVNASVGSEYHLALMALTLTGLRPAELEKGVRVELTAEGHLAFTVCGAKVTAIAGQPMRQIRMYVGDPVTRRLALHLQATGGKDGIVVSVSDARKFCDDVRALSARLFKRCKYVASPYSFRHAFSADMKTQNVSPQDLAMMMGHVTERSQRGYGSRNQGRSPFIIIHSVTAKMPVRAAKVSAAAAAWTDAQPCLANGCRYSERGDQAVLPAIRART